MKRIFPIIIFILFYSALSGQTKTNAVSGKIIEATTKLPLEFAFVSILQPNDSLLVSGTVTDKNGAFKLDSLSDGKYYLIISLLGYDTISTPEFSLPIANGGNDLGKIFMKTSGLLLDDVQITEEKSTYVNTIDRKVYFPEKDIQAQTGSASDILQNVPSITVDEEGGLSLRGSANVTILINGKPSQLMNANAA
ncbi:MAG: TonB-dependent receptor, partial [Bacteroidetes bacterium]|nr:TonB-dependent receptor [Bacteroidota bacterium]